MAQADGDESDVTGQVHSQSNECGTGAGFC